MTTGHRTPLRRADAPLPMISSPYNAESPYHPERGRPAL